MEEYRVKGSSISSKFRFVYERFGGGAERDIKQRFDSSFFPILDSNWYPYTLYEGVILAIAEQFFDSDLTRLRVVGEFSAQSVLTTIYKFFASGKDFVDFLHRAEKLHETCYNKGGMVVEVAPDRFSCMIEISAPIFREIDMYIAAGFYEGAARLFGAKRVECRPTMLKNAARFDISWS